MKGKMKAPPQINKSMMRGRRSVLSDGCFLSAHTLAKAGMRVLILVGLAYRAIIMKGIKPAMKGDKTLVKIEAARQSPDKMR